MKSKKSIKGSLILFILTAICTFGISRHYNYIEGRQADAFSSTAFLYYADYTWNGKTTRELCYVNNGEIKYDYTGVVKCMEGDDGCIDGEPVKYYIENGKVNRNKTGIVKQKEAGIDIYYNIVNGKVKVDPENIVKIGNEWYFAKWGEVKYQYNGFAENSNGWWYLENGKITFKSNGLYQGCVVRPGYTIWDEGKFGWYYVKNSKVQFINSVIKNGKDWCVVFDGKYDDKFTGIARNENGWWYIENGKVNFKYTGFAQNDNGWGYIENGKVNFNKNDVVKGKVEGENGWWFVKGGKVQFTDSVEKNSNGWWKISNGRVDFSYTGVAKNSNGWWYCENGKVNFNFNGISSNKNGLWYCKNGKADFTKNGSLKYKGINYKITGGKATPLNHTHTWATRTVSDNNAYDDRIPVYDDIYMVCCCECNNAIEFSYDHGKTYYYAIDGKKHQYSWGAPCPFCDRLDCYYPTGEVFNHYEVEHHASTTHKETYCTKCGMIQR